MNEILLLKVLIDVIELGIWIITHGMNETDNQKVLPALIELRTRIVIDVSNENNSGIKFPTIIFCQKH